MPSRSASFSLTSPEDTARVAEMLGRDLVPGDTLLLNGPVGAGKTHFARCLIQSLLSTPEDVPSPTFTLVQTYETVRGPLWHADLYRIGSVFEIEELGLAEAFDDAICLVEWPDRLGELEPAGALTLWFTAGAAENTRHLNATWTDDRWAERLAVLEKS
jgi:tRNA threonylcarbamoyladenosine biosynthesis protein TsaE